jgi:hypothetical protein
MSIDFNRDIIKDPERIAKMIYNKWKENHYEFKETSNSQGFSQFEIRINGLIVITYILLLYNNLKSLISSSQIL